MPDPNLAGSTLADVDVVRQEHRDRDDGRALGRWHDLWGLLRHDARFLIATILLGLFALMAAYPQLLTPSDPQDCSLSRSLDPPTLAHPFGFDLQGCDYYTLTVYGARTSLMIGVSVVLVAAVIAVALGSLAGYAGGIADAVISRTADMWFAVPLLLGGMFFLSFIERRGMLQVTLVLSLLAWPAMARMIRASVLETKNEEFVLSARALGASHARILFRHVIPNSVRPLIVYGALFTATTIAAEAILSFMGVGLQLPAHSWGLMLAGIRPSLRTIPQVAGFDRLAGNPHLLIPGAFLTAAVFAFVLLSDALRDALDPTHR